jgi:branched-chain amino acid transport system ATP-binding protein
MSKSHNVDTKGRQNTDTVLEISDLRKEFGGLVALNGVDLEVRDGETVGLIGPNGAGKSTLFNCIMGIFDADGGSVSLRNEAITNKETSSIIQEGVSRTFQTPRVFGELTVRENLIINQDHQRERMVPTLFANTEDAVMNRIEDLLEFISLAGLADQPAAGISTGQQKLLNLGCTLVSEPEIVLLDEPTAGVNPALVDDIIDAIRELGDEGTTFLIIEHDMNVIRELSDYLYVLANGENLIDAQPDTALEDDRVLKAYFGE